MIQEIDFFCSTDSSSYNNYDKIRNINNHYRLVISEIIKANQAWQWNDFEATSDLPVGVKSLIEGINAYELIKDDNDRKIITLDKVFVRDEVDGDWRELKQSDREIYTDVEEGEPQYYDLVGGALVLDKKPASTIENGIKVHIQTDIKDLEDDDDEPSFNPLFHRILTYGATIDYLASQPEVNDARLVKFDGLYQVLMEQLRQFYRIRNKGRKRRIGVKGDVMI